MTWALVFMICARMCEPHYVELYSSKAECVAKVDNRYRSYCIPVYPNK